MRRSGRPRPPSASLANPRSPALSSRPLPPRPFPAGVPAERCFTPSRVPEKQSHAGRAGRALGPRSLAEGGAWWGGSAGEVFKLEPEPSPRGSGSRGAVEQPWASAGRDPGVWRGVGLWGGRVCARCAGAARERSGGRAEPGRSRPAGEAASPSGNRLSRAPGERGVRLVHPDVPRSAPQSHPSATAPTPRAEPRLTVLWPRGSCLQLIFPAKGEAGVPI